MSDRITWTCPHCGRLEDGTGPCAHTGPPRDLLKDIKEAAYDAKVREMRAYDALRARAEAPSEEPSP